LKNVNLQHPLIKWTFQGRLSWSTSCQNVTPRKSFGWEILKIESSGNEKVKVEAETYFESQQGLFCLWWTLDKQTQDKIETEGTTSKGKVSDDSKCWDSLKRHPPIEIFLPSYFGTDTVTFE